MKTLLMIILYFTITGITFSQSVASYFPLKAGNVWYYKTTYSPIPFQPTYQRVSIEKDTLINGIKYFKYNDSRFIRIDSVKGNLLVYFPGDGCGSYVNDKILDSLASSPGDQIECQYFSIFTRLCTSENTQTVFGITTDTKEFHHDGLVTENLKYAKNFGIIYSCSGEPPPCTGFTNLIGCKLDGVVYGDTNLVDVTNLNTSVPDKFYLTQNYPNPFNPSTNLEFGILEFVRPGRIVSLKVYDGLGREVTTLVNERLAPGIYNYQLSADNYQLPSGVYFYKLEAGDFVETRRMVLLK